MLLIFDGLDEIKESFYQSFISNLNSFIELHPDIKVTVSSRFNFYDLKTHPLRGFEIYILKPLLNSDIDNYINIKLTGDKNKFLSLLENKGFSEYIDNPYYLTRLARFYTEKKDNFPNNKSELFQTILFEQLEKDEGKFNVDGLKEKLLPIAQQIAFCMTLAGKSSLTDEEIKTIVPQNDIRRDLKHFCILNRNSTSKGQWFFEHKNLQEYLCASTFQHQPFNDIIGTISYTFNRNKLQPKFLNTVSFLFESLNKESQIFNEIFNWLNTYEPELLIRFEKEQISKETRKKIFEKILEYYEQKDLTLRMSPNFSLEEIAYFIGIDENIIDYIKQKLKTVTDTLAYDLLKILSFTPKPYIHKETLLEITFEVLETPKYTNYVQAACIDGLIEYDFIDQEIFNRILNSKIDLNDFEIRQSIINYLNKSQFQNEYADFIVTSIGIYDISQKDTLMGGSNEMLRLLLVKLTSINSIKILLHYLTDNLDIISLHGYDRNIYLEYEDLKNILNNVVTIYKEDKSILKTAYRLYRKLERKGLYQEWFTLFVNFFDQTCGKSIIFYKSYKYERKRSELMAFADEDCCNFLINENLTGKIDNKEIFYLRNSLSYINFELYTQFNNNIKQKTTNEYLPNEEINYKELQDEYEIKNMEMLLKQDLFLKEIEEIFTAHGKDTITSNELWILNEYNLISKYRFSIVLEQLRKEAVRKTGAAKTDVLEKYRQADFWNRYLIDTTLSLVKKKRENIPELLIEKVKDYCVHNINTLDFNCIRDNEDGSFSYDKLVAHTNEIYLLFNIDISDDLLIKMLPSDYNYFFSENDSSLAASIVGKVKDRDALKLSILNNIKSLSLSRYVLCSHFKLCKELGYNECLGKLYETIINNTQLRDYNRTTLTEYYIELGGEITDFVKHLKVPTCKTDEETFTSWYWFLIEKLLTVEPDLIKKLLGSIIRDNEQSKSNKTKACELLIRLNDIDGLRFWGEYVQTYNGLPFKHRWEFMQKHVPLMSYKDATTILLTALNYTYKNELDKTIEFPNSISEVIYGCLTVISLQSYHNYTGILAELQKILSDYPKESFSENLKYFIERLTHRFYEKTSLQEIDIVQANLLYKKTMFNN